MNFTFTFDELLAYHKVTTIDLSVFHLNNCCWQKKIVSYFQSNKNTEMFILVCAQVIPGTMLIQSTSMVLLVMEKSLKSLRDAYLFQIGTKRK